MRGSSGRRERVEVLGSESVPSLNAACKEAEGLEYWWVRFVVGYLDATLPVGLDAGKGRWGKEVEDDGFC